MCLVAQHDQCWGDALNSPDLSTGCTLGVTAALSLEDASGLSTCFPGVPGRAFGPVGVPGRDSGRAGGITAFSPSGASDTLVPEHR